MFRAGIFCFFIFLYFIGVSSLSCYRCNGPKHSDCARGIRSGMTVQACGSQPQESFHFVKYFARELTDPENNKIDSDFVKSEYSLMSEEYNLGGKSDRSVTASPFFDVYCIYLEMSGSPETAERRCGYVAPNQNPCAFIQKTNSKVKICQACRSNLCN